jgi:coenzyme F420-reducing hydrogenase delta subunit
MAANDPQGADPGLSPRIIGFACNHCGYAAADSAGGLRREYPPAIHLIRLPCTGRLEIIHLLTAVEAGADGVFVVGCMEGDCSFSTGNLWARKCVDHAKRLLEEVGMEPDRLEMYNIPGPNGAGFAAAANEFTGRIVALGPSPARRDDVSPVATTREAVKEIALPDDAASPVTTTIKEGPRE